MCRNIKPLFNFDPPATSDEIEAAALQFVRKLTGFNKPSAINEPAFNEAIKQITQTTQTLLKTLTTNAPHKNREQQAHQAKLRSEKRFGKSE